MRLDKIPANDGKGSGIVNRTGKENQNQKPFFQADVYNLLKQWGLLKIKTLLYLAVQL
jgi:hypothetical protein